MNFLAHLALSNHQDQILVGNFLTDFLNKREAELLPAGYFKGVELHYFIDNFTDTNATVRDVVAHFIPKFGKLTPVVIDIFFDHLLAKNWDNYYPISFDEFAGYAYQTLDAHKDVIPVKHKLRVHNMVQEQWLDVYLVSSRMEKVFFFLSKRIPYFKTHLLDAHLVLEAEYDFLERAFSTFYKKLSLETSKKVEYLLLT